MAGLSAAGIGSGLDVNGIIEQLMSLERRPLTLLKRQETDLQAQLSSIGKLKSSLSSFQSAMGNLSDATKFKAFSATVQDESYFTASAGSSAAAGTYSVEVEQLAQAHKMASAATGSATVLGTGGDSIRIDLGSTDDPAATGSFEIDVGGKTLSQIRDAINTASDNPGVTATLINEDGGQRLVLSGDESGSSNQITVSDVTGSVAADNLQLSTLRTAQDARVFLEGSGGGTGYLVTSPTNVLKNAIDGVTIDLKQATEGEVKSLSIGRDTESVTENVQSFVDKYNDLMGTLKSLREGNLSGDSSIRSIESQIRNVVNTAASGTGSFSYLSEVGITTNKDTGKFELDAAKLDDALTTDFDSISELFANDNQGFARRLESLADSLLDSTGGLLKAREDGLNGRVQFIQDRQSGVEYRLEQVEARYRKQFSALDGMLGQMQTTSAYLSQQLAGLPFSSR